MARTNEFWCQHWNIVYEDESSAVDEYGEPVIYGICPNCGTVSERPDAVRDLKRYRDFLLNEGKE